MHRSAHLAAQASLAAHEQGKFWPMHDKLFANFRTLSRDNILGWAKEIGLDVEKFTKALDEEKFKATADTDMADGTKVGVRGTPSFFVNGRLYTGARSLEAIKPVIDAELKGGWKAPESPIKIFAEPVATPAAAPTPAPKGKAPKGK